MIGPGFMGRDAICESKQEVDKDIGDEVDGTLTRPRLMPEADWRNQNFTIPRELHEDAGGQRLEDSINFRNGLLVESSASYDGFVVRFRVSA